MRSTERASLIVLLVALAAGSLAAGRFGSSHRARYAGAGQHAASNGDSSSGGSLANLSVPAEAILARIPGVESVELLVEAEQPRHRIVHIADWHFVSREDFAADIRDQADDVISDENINELYAEHIAEVQRVQAAQRELLRGLIRRHGVQQVYCEGLTDADLPIYQAIIGFLRRRCLDERDLAAGQEKIDETVLRIGAVGQLLATGELAEVLPAEDANAYEQADPLLGHEGKLAFEGPANDARQLAIVRRLLANGPLAVLILGGGHDLSEQVRQLGGGRCEYVRVTVVNAMAATAAASP
jgi:hypothetical protein